MCRYVPRSGLSRKDTHSIDKQINKTNKNGILCSCVLGHNTGNCQLSKEVAKQYWIKY